MMSRPDIKVMLEDIKNADFIEVERHNESRDKRVKLVRNGERTFSFKNYMSQNITFYEEEICNFIINKAWTVKLISIPIHEKKEPKEDMINKPSHYHSGGIDVIAFAEAQCTHEELRGFYKINVWKYTARAEKKNGLEDYKKAEFYQKRLLELEKQGKEEISNEEMF